jgi:aryl-alcohol dehydrogenase-like predicted oxidoreductase
VQLGLPYGIANRYGQPNDEETRAILDLAWQNNVRVFDTAHAYGDSETRIGRWRSERGAAGLRIVSKVPPVPAGASSERRAFVREQIAASRAALQSAQIDVMMTHKGEDLLDEAIVAELQDATARGVIGAFGASIYNPDTGLRLLEDVPLAAMQVPASLVDKRFERAGVLKQANAAGVTVFVRSAFLQGALLLEPKQLPPYLTALKKPIAAIRQLAAETGRPIAEILLVAARDIPGADSVVVGVERAAQLQPHLMAIASPPLTPAERAWLDERINDMPEAAVDPSRWPR